MSKIAFFSAQEYDKEHFTPVFEASNLELTYFDTVLDKSTYPLANGHKVVCAFVNDKIDAETLEGLHHQATELVALRCAGFNNIDLKAAQKFGIKVCRVPAYSPEAVAEHALALILTLNRKIHKAYNRVRESNFSLNHLKGFNLKGKRVGVIGTGMIGCVFAKIMKGLGCEVVAFDPYPSDQLTSLGIRYLPLFELFAQSDIISLHCPLSDKTKHLIDREAIGKMKKGVMIINTSRGGLIHSKAVIQGLKSGQIGNLGIDVYEQEEGLFFKDLSGTVLQDDDITRLMTFPNVLITGHQGFLTREALDEIAETTYRNISDFLKGLPLPNEINANGA